MIDSTVIKMGTVEIGEHTYIGPNCILGFPLSDEITHEDIDLNNQEDIQKELDAVLEQQGGSCEGSSGGCGCGG